MTSGMRNLAKRSYACISYALAVLAVAGLAGCTPSDRDFVRDGAGSDLMSDQTVAATASLDRYFGEICAQAGLSAASQRPLRCQTDGFDERAWHSLVKAGMNDIDHRCDRYLAWLENRRNEKLFVDSTITAVGTTTAGVLGVAGTGAEALSYVALALGFTSSMYNAYYTRALLGIEPSTITMTVEKRRLEFRSKFLDARYQERADVVYTLRTYLRICTPQTIVMDVNAYARAVISNEDPPQVANLELERRAIETVRPVTSPALVVRVSDPKPPKEVTEAINGDGYSLEQLNALRRKLCVHTPDAGNARTMAAIKIWESQVYAAKPDDEYHNGRIDDREWTGVDQRRGLRDVEDCSKRWRNLEESALFQGNPKVEEQFVIGLNRVVPVDGGKSLDDSTVRNAIAKARQLCNLPPPPGLRDSDLTNDLSDKIVEWASKPEGSACE